MNNHQDIKYDFSVKISYRHLRFADIFLSTRKINVSKLNLKNRISRRSVTRRETNIY